MNAEFQEGVVCRGHCVDHRIQGGQNGSLLLLHSPNAQIGACREQDADNAKCEKEERIFFKRAMIQTHVFHAFHFLQFFLLCLDLFGRESKTMAIDFKEL
jgi:hypothetical protein